MTTMNSDFGEDEDTDDSIDKSITADYGKITRAIVQARNSGVNIELPDINRAEADFVPDVENNAIIFSLQSVSGVNAELVNAIIANRPYTSIEDFVAKVDVSRQQMFALLKAGAFDALYPTKARGYIVMLYLNMLANDSVSIRSKFTMANLPLLENLCIVPSELDIPRRVVRFEKWEKANEYVKDEKRYKIEHPSAINFFENYFKPIIDPTEYSPIPNGYSVSQKAFNKACSFYTDKIRSWLTSDSLPEQVYETEKKAFVTELFHKYFDGSVSVWEMDTLHFYHGPHELANVNEYRYGLVDFENLPEEPEITSYTFGKDGVQRPVYKLHNICGTVVNSDNLKHIVTLLTNQNKIVDVKFYKEMYNNYNKKISIANSEGKKTVVDDSWFAKGALLMITGFRRENSFVPRADWEHGIRNPVRLITGVTSSGEVTVKTKREETA